MNGFIGGVIIKGIGTFIKWCFFSFVTLFTNKDFISYNRFTEQKEKVNDYDAIFLGASDSFVGLIFCSLVLILIYYFY
jgi:hypothetical protein